MKRWQFWILAAILAWFGRDGLRAEEPAVNPALLTPRSAPLSELHSVKLMNLSLQESLIQQIRQQLMQEVCAAAKFSTCQVSPDFKTVYEVRPQPRPQPGSLRNESGTEASSQKQEK